MKHMLVYCIELVPLEKYLQTIVLSFTIYSNV